MLKQISEIPFGLEREVQRLVEGNMRTLFGLTFIASEFMLHDLRVDTLGFDDESHAFIIIEYKRDKNFSVIDQGYAYLALMLNNKADFILLHNQKTSKSLKKEDVDWSQSRIIFIAPFYTTYQRKAIELKDLPIELWEIKKYSNNTILFSQIQHPEKVESIKTISQKSQIIKNVSKEVVVYTEDVHLENKPETVVSLYNELKEHVFTIGQDITVKPKKVYIAFTRKANFLYAVPRKTDIQLILNLERGTLNDPKELARDVSKLGHHGSGDYEIKLGDPKDIGYVLTLIRQSYDKN